MPQGIDNDKKNYTFTQGLNLIKNPYDNHKMKYL